MEDVMHIQSAFLRSVIAQAISKTARKQGYKSSVCGMLFVFMGLLVSPEVMELIKDLSR